MAIDVEVRIIHADGTAAAWRDLDQPLAQPWKHSDPARDYLPQVGHVEITGSIQDQDDRELLRDLAGIHCQNAKSAAVARQLAALG